MTQIINLPRVDAYARLVEQETLHPLITSGQKEWGWEGIIGKSPSLDLMRQYLQESDLLLYCGHGSGEKYIPRKEIEALESCGAALLIGCASGRLQSEGEDDPSGTVWSYLSTDCPGVMGLLWDVTDRDIDKFTLTFLAEWLGNEGVHSASSLLHRSREDCKLKALTGFAPVFYGLPLSLVKDFPAKREEFHRTPSP